MKKLFLLITSFTLSVVMCAQNMVPTEFYGLSFENRYTLKQFLKHVKNKGVYMKTERSVDLFDGKWDAYIFRDAKYEGNIYPEMSFLFVQSDVFGGVQFTYTENSLTEGQTMSSLYNDIVEDMSIKYDLIESHAKSKSHSEKIYVDTDNNVLSISHEIFDNKEVVEVSYFSVAANTEAIRERFFPTIQDSFFGMKLGSKPTTAFIERALLRRGIYIKEEYESVGKSVLFKNVVFAGRRWDFCCFLLDNEGRFYCIRVYDSLENDDDGRKSAISIYNSYKDKLFEKYGTTKESGDEGEKCIIYSGNNDVVLILSNKTGKSIGGEYRRYVDLGYSLGSISDEIVNQNEDEL